MTLTRKMTNSILAALEKEDILKDIFPDLQNSFAPKGTLLVDYPTKDNTVALGNSLSVANTQAEPTVVFKPFESIDTNDKFTLVMTDPDAPSRTDRKWGEYCHFVVTDISFDSENAGEIVTKNNNILVTHMGPGPPKGTGLHRYIFLLFKQLSNNSTYTEIKDRINWGYGTPSTGVGKWSKENNLELLAVNYFQAENK